MKKILVCVVSSVLAMAPTLAIAEVSTSTSFSNWYGLQMPLNYVDSTPSNGATPIITGLGMFGLQFPTGTMSVDGGVAEPSGEYPNGPRLIKLGGSSTVFWVNENNLKLPMLNRTVFLSYKNKDSEVQTVSQEELDYYEDAQFMQIGSGIIYRIEGTTKRAITSQAWSESGLDESVIMKVNKTELNSYKTGAQITSAEDLGLG